MEVEGVDFAEELAADQAPVSTTIKEEIVGRAESSLEAEKDGVGDLQPELVFVGSQE